MSNPITDLLTGGFGEILKGVSGILDHFVTDPQKKLEAQLKLTEMGNAVTMRAMDAERDLAVQQASVVTAEIKSDSWLAANWRPVTMLTFVFIIVWNYIIVGTVGAFVPRVHVIDIPPDMWGLLKLGIGGYIGARTLEKTIPQVVEAIKK